MTLSDSWTFKKHADRYSKIVQDLVLGISRAEYYAHAKWGSGINLTPIEKIKFDAYMKLLNSMRAARKAIDE